MKKIFFLIITIIALMMVPGCNSKGKLEKFYLDLQNELNYKVKMTLVTNDKREMHSTIYLDNKIAKAEVKTILPDGTISPLITSYFDQPQGQHVYQITYDEQSDKWIRRFSGETKMIGTLDPDIFDPENFTKNANNKYTLKPEYTTYFDFASLTIEFKSGKIYLIGTTSYESKPARLSYTISNIKKVKVTLPEFIEEKK